MRDIRKKKVFNITAFILFLIFAPFCVKAEDVILSQKASEIGSMYDCPLSSGVDFIAGNIGYAYENDEQIYAMAKLVNEKGCFQNVDKYVIFYVATTNFPSNGTPFGNGFDAEQKWLDFWDDNAKRFSDLGFKIIIHPFPFIINENPSEMYVKTRMLKKSDLNINPAEIPVVYQCKPDTAGYIRKTAIASIYDPNTYYMGVDFYKGIKNFFSKYPAFVKISIVPPSDWGEYGFPSGAGTVWYAGTDNAGSCFLTGDFYANQIISFDPPEYDMYNGKLNEFRNRLAAEVKSLFPGKKYMLYLGYGNDNTDTASPEAEVVGRDGFSYTEAVRFAVDNNIDLHSSHALGNIVAQIPLEKIALRKPNNYEFTFEDTAEINENAAFKNIYLASKYGFTGVEPYPNFLYDHFYTAHLFYSLGLPPPGALSSDKGIIYSDGNGFGSLKSSKTNSYIDLPVNEGEISGNQHNMIGGWGYYTDIGDHTNYDVLIYAGQVMEESEYYPDACYPEEYWWDKLCCDYHAPWCTGDSRYDISDFRQANQRYHSEYVRLVGSTQTVAERGGGFGDTSRFGFLWKPNLAQGKAIIRMFLVNKNSEIVSELSQSPLIVNVKSDISGQATFSRLDYNYGIKSSMCSRNFKMNGIANDAGNPNQPLDIMIVDEYRGKILATGKTSSAGTFNIPFSVPNAAGEETRFIVPRAYVYVDADKDGSKELVGLLTNLPYLGNAGGYGTLANKFMGTLHDCCSTDSHCNDNNSNTIDKCANYDCTHITTSVEICNNADDDIDGNVDEGCDDDKDTFWDSEMTCTGTYLAGNSQTYACIPEKSDCNDNNAEISHEGQTKSCTASNTCVGIQTITDCAWGPCVAQQNFCDNNCDGTPETCSSQQCVVCGCIGVGSRDCDTAQGCKGREECISGDWSGVCEMLGYFCDADCDGTADTCSDTPCAACNCISGSTQSCYTGPIATQNRGICTNGIRTCILGQWGTSCVGEILPQTEVCNSDQKDEDCDGQINENCECNNTETMICGTTDVGECNYGLKTCVGGHWQSCVGNIEPSTEVCDANNKDEDCDGTSNEGCECINGATQTCGTDAGECKTGTQTCSGGIWSECTGQITPTTEICDTKDNDCDGEIDEGCECITANDCATQTCKNKACTANKCVYTDIAPNCPAANTVNCGATITSTNGCGTCTGTGTKQTCNDNNACTTDTCTNAQCVFTAITPTCPAASTINCGTTITPTNNCGTCTGTGTKCSSGTCNAGICTTTSSKTINATSCSLADVQAAIDSASSNDIVLVPPGNCIWGDGRRIILNGNYAYPSISINKSVSLVGSSTHISGSGTGYFIVYSPSDFSKNWPLRISGFEFDGKLARSGIYLAYTGIDHTIQDRIRIDHNTFQNLSGQAIWINGQRGVADNNIIKTSYPIRFASGDDMDWWNNWEGLVFGKANNNFYFEDNIIETDESVMDCQYGNRYAFRYNTIRALGPTSYPIFDMHGDVGTASGGCAYRSCFGSEMYGNNITLNSGYSDFRGGKHVVFYNLVSSTDSFWGLRDSESVTAGFEACECVYCPSTNPQPQHISDSYAWNNRGGSLSGVISNFFSREFKDCTAQCGYVVNENDEYFNYKPSFDGKTGVGCGTLANRPSTCTPGVGYWATSQSCSNLAGMVGANHAENINGIFYKCTSANTWTAYYTPLSYPHPLRTDCTNHPTLCDSTTTPQCTTASQCADITCKNKACTANKCVYTDITPTCPANNTINCGAAITSTNGCGTCNGNGTKCATGTTCQNNICAECTNGQTRQCGSTNVGECEYGTQTCTNGAWSITCVGSISITSEICDGLDNDCDGSTDENFTNKGTSCTAGIGECRKTGVYVCNSQKNSTICNATAGNPTNEICDNKDNDCDGSTDESLTESCYTGASGTQGVGLCKAGTQSCNAGNWSSCTGQVIPAAEICDANSNDEDCDGTPNEGCTCIPGQTRICGTNNIGICKLGTQTCNDHAIWGNCTGAINPVNEICDNLDNDCDGIKDDNLTNTTANQNGRCLGNTMICTNGAWIAKSSNYTPQNETCNGLDDDCDASVDEELGNITCGFGICSHTIANCIGGIAQTCNPLQGSVNETCGDNLDNDCDNSTDEGCNCTEDWNCSDWSTCSANYQTRTCTDNNNCSTINGRPSLERTCSSGSTGGSGGSGGGSSGGGGGITPKCIESWSCSIWSICEQDGFRRRSCADDKKCGTSINKPKELETCLYLGNCNDGKMNGGESGIDCGGRCPKTCENKPDGMPLDISVDSIKGEVLDKIKINVVLENKGEQELNNIEIRVDKWSESSEKIYSLSPGMKWNRQISLSLPGNPYENSVEIQIIKDNAVISTKKVDVELTVPKMNLKIDKDEQNGKIYQAIIFDNRDNSAREIEVEFTINKDKETYFVESEKKYSVGEGELFQKVDYLLANNLPPGKYEVNSAYYENGDKIGEMTSFVVFEGNRKTFNMKYIFYVLLACLIGISAFIFFKSYKKEE